MALSERLRPLEYQISFITDAQDRLEVRIAAARLRRLEAARESRKVESLKAQLMAAVSHGRTIAAMKAVFDEEGAVAVVGQRTEALRAAAREAMRKVIAAENELREERNRQLAAEQARMAAGAVTKAEIASAANNL
jgi:hypothetical protein